MTGSDDAAAVDLVLLLERRGYRPVWRSKDGDKAVFHVPWRVDQHPSLAVYRRGSVWFWTDHARQESGTTIQAIQRLDGLDRKGAISLLTADGRPSPAPSRVKEQGKDGDRRLRVMEARRTYRQAREAMTHERAALLLRYWQERGIHTVPDIGAVWMQLPAGEGMRPYLGIPLPSPQKVRAIECRLLDGQTGADRTYRARTIGPKELWVFWRDHGRIVVTESVLDSLAYTQIWPTRSESLVALNGVGNVRLLPSLIEYSKQAGRPVKEVILALDNDQAGQQAAEKAAACCRSSSRIYRLDDHLRAGAKDLHKLLLKKIKNR